MRDEDRTGSQPQQERRDVSRPFFHVASVVGTASLFVSVYLATFIGTGYVARITGFEHFYWPALIGAAVATVVTVGIMERGRWNIGVFVPPQLAARDFLVGVALAFVLIAIADLVLLAASSMRHVRGPGFPWSDLWIVFAPAAMHEEVLFRGYLFQRIRVWNRGVAFAASSVVFAALHAGNRGIDVIAFVNLGLAGVLLCLAYERYGRLWFPFGLHLGWNVVSGPVFGYAVSGFEAPRSVLRFVGAAPAWLSGGDFGIEGGVIATLVEVIGITVLFVSRERTLERHRHR